MELRHLRYFLSAAEHGSFRKAAGAMGVEQSAISRRIRDLEDRLGASLFQRRNHGVSLTHAGERFLQPARRTLRQLGEGSRVVEAIGRGETGHLRIGIFSSLASGFLAELIRAFRESHRSVRIDFVDGDPENHLAAIRQMQLDVAFLTGLSDQAGCETTLLWFERVFLAMPGEHPLNDREQITWTDLAGRRFIVSDVAPGQEIQDYLIQRLADLGQHPDIQQQHVGRDNLLTLVAHGSGLTVTSEATTAVTFPGVIYRPIAGETLPFSAVWSRHNDNPALRRLLSAARSAAKKQRHG
ncbi:LysR family transcriptional regulator [Aurantimonas aggregata]|uniref:LysR family transcriptional regulator n=1 Tax=Aurantimonas aggregata TaxID=2047720 RepID=A0A6L9MMI2_9HYPH|nr:LysR family transcriptional regulator [Aurantimonas aggregata]